MTDPHLLTTQAVCHDDSGNIWFFSDAHNALYCFDFTSKQVRFVTSFYEEVFSIDSLYTEAIYYEKRIFFIPCVAKNIAIYNIESNTTEYIPLTEQIINFNVSMYTPDTYLLFPVIYSNTAYLLNLTTCTLKELPLSFGYYENEFSSSTRFIGNGIIEQFAYFAIYNSNRCIRYDITQNSICFFTLPINMPLFQVYAHNDELFFLSFDGCKIIETTLPNNQSLHLNPISVIPLADTPQKHMPRAYFHVLFEKAETLLTLPYNQHDLLRISSGKIENIPVNWTQTGFFEETVQAYNAALFFNNYLLVFPYRAKYILQIDLKTKLVTYIPINTCCTGTKEIFRRYFENQSRDFLFYEQQFSLPDLLTYL